MQKAVPAAILIALGVSVATLYWFTTQRDQPTVVEPSDRPRPETRTALSATVETTPSIRRTQVKSALDTSARRAAGLATFVEGKYRYLFADLRLNAQATEELRRLLVTREHLTSADHLARDVDLDQQRSTLLAIDQRVRSMLDGGAYALYEVLKESDAEQSHLILYEVTIANTAPLSPEQERAILEAKLRHKQRYDAIVKDAGLNWENPSAAERAYTRTTVTRALDEYKDNYLREARQILNDEGQYGALNSFETIEFKQELNRRQVAINAR